MSTSLASSAFRAFRPSARPLVATCSRSISTTPVNKLATPVGETTAKAPVLKTFQIYRWNPDRPTEKPKSFKETGTYPHIPTVSFVLPKDCPANSTPLKCDSRK
ncbi:hypothetical protein BT69DRAFT_1358805 [Atractiella rhizophila]|nr:hypothetical protein BT69DRAFT_1358805 [Atractiella rhizophila]